MVMRRPKLIHPVDVVLEQVDDGETAWDDQAREPVFQAAHSAAVTLKGQASYGSSADLSFERAGRRENESGYVLFRTADLEAAGVALRPNDRITKVGNVDHDVYITRLEPKGHYPKFGHTLVKAYFADRKPEKQRRTA